MKVKNKGWLLALLFILVFMLYACTPAIKITPELQKREKIVAVLKEAKKEMETVHTILSDQELDIANENESASQDAEFMEQVEKVIAKTDGYQAGLKELIASVRERDTLDEPVLENFNKSELHCIMLLNEVLEEYRQIADYIKFIYKTMNSISTLSQFDLNNLEQWYNTFSETVKTTIEELSAVTPPSFLLSFHEDIIKIYSDAQSMVDYILSAGMINDPLRIDAGMYRYGIFMRDTAKATENMQMDVERRIKKIKDDAAALKSMDEGLTAWIDRNLERLDLAEGSEKK